MRLSALFEERGEAYANANARVSLESMSINLLFCFGVKIVEFPESVGGQENLLYVFLQSYAVSSDLWTLDVFYCIDTPSQSSTKRRILLCCNRF